MRVAAVACLRSAHWQRRRGCKGATQTGPRARPKPTTTQGKQRERAGTRMNNTRMKPFRDRERMDRTGRERERDEDCWCVSVCNRHEAPSSAELGRIESCSDNKNLFIGRFALNALRPRRAVPHRDLQTADRRERDTHARRRWTPRQSCSLGSLPSSSASVNMAHGLPPMAYSRNTKLAPQQIRP
ncbi:Hypothetical predicted protein [Olea europaea subsp. europaea]|uniref:Uncharacterized protein n=1 Tax=Olea europaea subsp. europaea TaxID=158383 RepID=A0A8S0RCQ5_OLEEU|nr:Hypothetical predicted protein [Olea europaea subsp. europaea]